MSILNYKKELLSKEKISNLEDNYGVKINNTKNGKIKIEGKYSKDIEDVSNILKREIFLKKNQNNIPVFKSKKGSMSSKLIDINQKEKNYNNQKELFIMY